MQFSKIWKPRGSLFSNLFLKPELEFIKNKTSNTDLIAIVTEMTIAYNSPIQLIQLSQLKNDECHT